MSQRDELVSQAGAAYLPAAAYGRVPDPITLFAAAALVARDAGAGQLSHRQVYAGLIAGFWRGEFERRVRSAVFTRSRRGFAIAPSLVGQRRRSLPIRLLALE